MTEHQERIAAIRKDCEHFTGIGTKDVLFLLAQLDAAQADTRRLDWMEAVALERNVIASGIAPSSDTAMFSVGLERGGGYDDFEGFSLREAIDKALSAGVSPEATEGTNG
jgi:hypothetical protein